LIIFINFKIFSTMSSIILSLFSNSDLSSFQTTFPQMNSKICSLRRDGSEEINMALKFLSPKSRGMLSRL
jgi:hypothetical protein